MEPVEVALDYGDGSAGAEEIERETESLIEEIEQLGGVLRLSHPPAGPAPAGTRAGDVTAYSSLILGLAGAPAVRSLILLVQDWLARRASGTVTLQVGDDRLELSAGSPAERRRIVEAFLAHLESAVRAEQSGPAAGAEQTGPAVRAEQAGPAARAEQADRTEPTRPAERPEGSDG
ncbi:hypothetical protein TR51_03535 [Kitasatospora griseola]|uniref:Uncharacterized protein n=1 Tax=Kitasatospora griseola TaxID=2064 RepID=A0A0D0Q254_KITGR|nr:hypothetical protein TR51_03535 [Kitasatospora griseola]